MVGTHAVKWTVHADGVKKCPGQCEYWIFVASQFQFVIPAEVLTLRGYFSTPAKKEGQDTVIER